MSEWQPIESVPHGYVVLLASAGVVPPYIGSFQEGTWHMLVNPFAVQRTTAVLAGVPTPTHWMPLPKPPS